MLTITSGVKLEGQNSSETIVTIKKVGIVSKCDQKQGKGQVKLEK